MILCLLVNPLSEYQVSPGSVVFAIHRKSLTGNTGSPRAWIAAPLPFKLPRDNKLQVIDSHSVNFPESQLSPMFLAIEEHAPSFNLSQVDVVTDRNNLRKLLRWMGGNREKDIRIDLQLVGEKTVLMKRWDGSGEVAENRKAGYGHGFVDKMTVKEEGAEGKSAAHHRIVSYVSVCIGR